MTPAETPVRKTKTITRTPISPQVDPETEVDETSEGTLETSEKPRWPELTPFQIKKCKEIGAQLRTAIYSYENPNVKGEIFVFRGLKTREWEALARQQTPDEPESRHDERIARAAIIWPPNLDDTFWGVHALAGHASSISYQVQEHSGFPLFRPDGKLMSSNVFVTKLEAGEDDEDKPVDPAPPTEDELEAWRKISASRQLLFLDFAVGKKFVFRPLLRSEYHAILGKADTNTDSALLGCKTATVWPDNVDWENEVAGIVDTAFQKLLELSGFNVSPIITEL